MQMVTELQRQCRLSTEDSSIPGEVVWELSRWREMGSLLMDRSERHGRLTRTGTSAVMTGWVVAVLPIDTDQLYYIEHHVIIQSSPDPAGRNGRWT